MAAGVAVRWLAAPLLAAVGAPSAAVAQASDAELRAEIADLQRVIATLRTRVDALERATGEQPPLATRSRAPAEPAVRRPLGPGPSTAASRLPPRETFGDELTGVARLDNAPPPNDPQLKGFIPIPGTETMIRLGGFAKVSAIYDTSPAGNPDKLVTSTIPIGAGGTNNANLDANATRFSFEVRRPSSLGQLRFYLENDFYGGGSTTAFRLRQAHGQVGNTYAGYGYSAFTDSDAFPETLDDEGPGGEPLLRLAAIRQIWKVGDGLTATLSVEDPASDLALASGMAAAQMAPDVVGAMRIERPWGHVQASAVIRSIGYSYAGEDDSTFGYGLSLSALVKLGGDFAMGSFTYGDGIARYFNDLGGKGYDGVIGPDGDVRSLTAYGGYLGYTHHWSPNWRSSLVGGVVVLDRDSLLANTAFRSSAYGAVNLIWALSPSFSMGVEALYGRHELQDGQSADVTRLQASVKYDFVK